MGDEIRPHADALSRIPDPIALLQGLFAHSPVAFQIYSADGHSVLTNQAFRDLFGSEPPPEYNVLQDEIAEARGTLGLVHRAFAGETVTLPPMWYDPRELRQVSVSEGRRVAIAATFFPLFAHDGGVAYVAIAFRDMTAEITAREEAERGRAEAEAAQRRTAVLARTSLLLTDSLDLDAALDELARAVVPDLADMCSVFVVQSDGSLKRAAVAAGDPDTDARVRAMQALPVPPNMRGVVAEALDSGDVQVIPDYVQYVRERLGEDHEYTRAAQAIATGSVMVAPIVARGRRLGAVVMACREGTRRSFGAREVEVAREMGRRAGLAFDNARLFSEAQQANRAKDGFLAMLSHELRNPLSPIVTALELMRLRDGGALQREREVIERQVRYLQRLVDDLLDVSRITRGMIELRRARVDAAAVVHKAVETASPLLEERRHRLVVDVPAGLPLDADADRLAQVMANLLSNAARYTGPGGDIAVRGWREGDEVVLSVRDTGEGIPPEVASSIFDPFVQGHRGLARSQGGLGLGLAIARSLVELHGGRVSAHSEGRGRGSEFVVRLPAAGATEAEAPPLAARPPGQLDGMRVLVVDDNADAAEMLAEALRTAGAEAVTAADGPTALAVARSLHPDVVLLDIGLPVMDGYEVARHLRAQSGPQAPLIIAVTGYGQEADRVLSRAAGFDEHLVKPVEAALVVQTIARLTGRAGDAVRGAS